MKKNETIKKAYGLYCNDNFIYAYQTKSEAEDALASRIQSKCAAAARIASKDYEDCADPATEFEFDKILASNEYEIDEIEIDYSDSPSEVEYRITRDDEPFMSFQNKNEAVSVFLELSQNAVRELKEKLNDLAHSNFDEALSFEINYNEADALLWEIYQIPRYRIFPVPRES